ncbi:peptidylprolyl isomerase [Changchengzhania lutea]|uniref:peptidylprolyl isomerase n=1 Tax=Changchengzhania lutea TaxID=2049305 RepID=UPI00115F3B25|nr:peptidylprolyl isomerase [Changchengzhania lutea]
MKLKYIITLLLTVALLKINAQSSQKKILFTVDGTPVYVSEFIRVYNKNLDLVQDESQKDVNEYLKLFTNYKLKLKEAQALSLNEKESYKRELANYKKQLAKGFLTNTEVTEELVAEAYDRISNEVKANHILVRVLDNASPADTLVAYNTISKLRERALNGDFESLRKEVHNGKTIFGEELGYFSGFKMVYTFETVAFNTEVGEISEIFRTRFGYHFLKVLDKRKSRGERTVAHIMKVSKPNDSLNESPEEKIKEIYKRLNQGGDFEALAKEFSDDTNSAGKGGVLNPFSGGELSASKFEDAAFALEDVGDVSKPFQSKFGWHIVKLLAKKPIGIFEEMKSELEAKVKRDDRSNLIDDALIRKLKAKYDISDNQPALPYFEAILNDDYFKNTWQLNSDFEADKPLVKIGNKQFLFQDFADYLLKTQGSMRINKSIADMLASKYQAFLNKNLVDYQEANLEYENKEFANILAEYRDGLLLFDLMETTIWNTSKTDSTEIRNFYDTHKNDYTFPKRIEATVASSAQQKTLKKVRKLLEKGMAIEQIKSLVNSNEDINVIFTTDTMDVSHQAIPKDFQFKKGVSKIYNHNDGFVVIQVTAILPKSQKSFEEARGMVIGDYQTFKEAQWMEELHNKYKVVINQESLDKVKSIIKNQ